MIPEEKLAYERKLVGDLWEFRKRFYVPDSTDGYWVELVKAADELQTAYRGSVYASALIRANIEDFERRAEVGSNSGLMLVQLDEGGKMPCRMTEGAAGSDLCTVNTVVFMPGDTEVVHTGVHVRPQKGTVGLLFIRSSLSKVGLGLSTGVSVIDPDYTGEIVAYIRNYGNEVVEIKTGDRVCQIVFVPYVIPSFKTVGRLPETARGDGGFGSTGRGAHEN